MRGFSTPWVIKIFHFKNLFILKKLRQNVMGVQMPFVVVVVFAVGYILVDGCPMIHTPSQRDLDRGT